VSGFRDVPGGSLDVPGPDLSNLVDVRPVARAPFAPSTESLPGAPREPVPSLPRVATPPGEAASETSPLEEAFWANPNRRTVRGQAVSVDRGGDVAAFEEVIRANRRMRSEESAQAMITSLRLAMQTNPDLRAEAHRVAEELGISVEAAERNVDVLRQVAYRRSLLARDFFRANPILARKTQDLMFSRLAHDDLEQLAKVGKLAAAWDRGTLEVERGRLGNRARQGIATEEDLARVAKIDATLDYLPNPSGFLAGSSHVLGQLSQTAGKALAVGVGMGTSAASGVALVSAGPQAAITLPAAFLSGFGAGASAAFGYQSFEIEGGNAYLDMINRGYDEDTARGVALGVGGVSALLEVVGINALAAPVKKAVTSRLRNQVVEGLTRRTYGQAARQFAIDYAIGAGGEVLTEVAQTGVQIAGEEIARRISQASQPADAAPLESTVTEGGVGDALLEAAAQAAQGIALLAVPGPAMRLAGNVRRVQQAEAGARFLSELSSASKDSKLRGRAPERFAELLKEQLGPSGAQNLFVDRAAFDEALRQSQVTREEAEQALPGLSTQLAESGTTRPDVVIPTAEFVARLAGTPLGDALMQRGRFDPDGLSPAEAQQQREKIEEMAQKARQQIDAMADEQAAHEDAGGIVEADLRNQLIASKVLSAQDAAVSSKLYRAFVETWAADQGISPLDFHSTYGPLVKASRAEDTPGARAGDRAAFQEGSLTIRLFEASDVTSFLHESGHYFLSVLGKMAGSPQATPRMRETMQAAVQALGIESVETWQGMSIEAQRKAHESFALRFEQYLHDGKAPSLELQGVFRKFGRWLRRVYGEILRSLNAAFRRDFNEDLPALTPELRAVFDRLLASDQQIQRAQAVRQLAPLFRSQEQAPLSAEEWARYEQLVKEAGEVGADELGQSLMQEMQFLGDAKSRVLKELQAEQRQVRRQVGEEVAREVNSMPVFRLRAWLRDGRFRDENGGIVAGERDANHRLQTTAVQAMVPPGTDTKRMAAWLSQDGVHPDQLAPAFGYESGQAMVRDLLTFAPLKEVIEARTNERMLLEHADLADPDLQTERVVRALHNETWQEIVALQLKGLSGSSSSIRVMKQAAREAARQALGNRKVSEIQVRDFSAAAARAGRQAREAFARGDMRAVQAAQRQELVQHAMVREAAEARDEIRQARKEFERLFGTDENLGKKRDVSIVNAGRALLSMHGLGVFEQSPLEWLQQVKTYNPELHDELLQEVAPLALNAKPWQTLTLDEFRDLRETIAALWWRSERDRTVVLDGKKAQLEDVAKLVVERFEAIGLPPTRGETGNLTKLEKAAANVRQFVAAATRIEHALLDLDGKEGGILHRALFRRLQEAAVRFRKDRLLVTENLQQIVEAVDFGVRRKIESPELGFVFGRGSGNGKAEVLMALLHSGNWSNLTKLLVGRGWGDLREDGSVDTGRWDAFVARMINEGVLTKADFDFAQRVWNLNKRLLPIAQKAHHELYGYHFREIPARTIETPFGVYLGGYVPAKTDKDLVAAAGQRFAEEAIKQMLALPIAPRGFAMNRKDFYNRQLDLDLMQLASHVDQVLLFAHMQPAMRDVARLLNHHDVKSTLEKFDPSLLALLKPWVARAGTQVVTQSGPENPILLGLNTFRRHVGMGAMFLNVKNSLQNYTGLFPALLKVKPQFLLRELPRMFSGAAAREVAELSPAMNERLGQQVYDIRDRMQELAANQSGLRKAQQWFQRHAYVLQRITQNHVDVAVWRAKFNEVLAELSPTMSREQAHAEAVLRADSAVRTTQMDQNPESLSSWEAGSTLQKLITQFSSWFINWGNLNLYEGKRRLREGGGAYAMAGLYVFGLMLPMVTAEAIELAFDRDPIDEDEDGAWADDVAARFLRAQVSGVAAAIPLAGRGLQLAMDVFTDDKGWNNRMPAPPVVSVLTRGVNGLARLGDPEVRHVRSALELLNLFLGIPVHVVAKPVLAMADRDR
jgi:hypothetical protein